MHNRIFTILFLTLSLATTPQFVVAQNNIEQLFQQGFLTLVTLAAIAPGTHTFEGNIISQEMSFIYNGQQPKRFIENISGIKQLESEGIQILTFTGKFESEFSQLNQSKSLKIQLKDRESKWIIAAANSEGTSESV
ncbi:hypothetical protein LC609_31585 [Nostoc sp. XA013]|nr:hypothetical protein [Nostoc sp. XA013]